MDIKVSSFSDLEGNLSEEEKKIIDLDKTLLQIQKDNVDEVIETVEGAKGSILSKIEYIEYLMTIRPNKIQYLFTVFKYLIRKSGIKRYTPKNSTFFNILYNYGTNDDPYSLCEKGSIERSIEDDDIDLFISLSSEPGFDPNKKVIISGLSSFICTICSGGVTYLELMAFFGSIKCFKRAFYSRLFTTTKTLNKFAIAGGNYEIIQILREVSENFFDECFSTAVLFHQYQICDWLLENYKCQKVINLSCFKHYNYFALLFSERNNDVLCYPLTSGQYSARYYDELVIKFVRSGNLEATKFLLEKAGSQYKNEKNNPRKLINLAFKSGSMELIKYFDQKIRFENKDDNKTVSFMNALSSGSLEVLKFAYENYGSNEIINERKKDNLCEKVAKTGSLEIAKYILEKISFSSEQEDIIKKGLLLASAVNNTLDHVKYFIEKLGFNKSGCEIDKDVILRLAEGCSEEVLKYFIEEKGFDVKQADEKGLTLLHFAAIGGNIPIIKMLINEYGFDVNIRSKNGVTPLKCSVISGQLPTVRFFVEKCHCNPKELNDNEESLLHFTAACGHFPVFEYLVLNCGCDPKQVDKKGKAPFYYAFGNVRRHGFVSKCCRNLDLQRPIELYIYGMGPEKEAHPLWHIYKKNYLSYMIEKNECIS